MSVYSYVFFTFFLYLAFQQELIRKAGMRSVRQACGETFEEVEEFLKSETFPVVSENESIILKYISIAISF